MIGKYVRGTTIYTGERIEHCNNLNGYGKYGPRLLCGHLDHRLINAAEHHPKRTVIILSPLLRASIGVFVTYDGDAT